MIGVFLIATVHTAERLLAHAIRAIHIMATRAFLGGISGFDGVGGHASFGGGPFDLLRDMRQVGGVEVGIHGTCLVLHGGDRQVFIGELGALVLSKALVDRAVDLLAHMAGETLPALAAGRWEFRDPLLLETLAQPGLAAAFLPVALLSLSEFPVKGAVVLAGTGRQEVSGKGERRYRRSLP